MSTFILRDAVGREYPVGTSTSIGREQTCQIVLDDPSVSRIHATIGEQQGILYVRDENSRNGTFVGGTRLAPAQPTPLRVGDQLRVGNVTFSVTTAQEAVASAPTQYASAPTLVGAAPPAQPPKSKTPLILGCLALVFLGIIGFCVVSTCGLAALSGSATRTPAIAVQGATTIPSIKVMATATTAGVSVSNPLRTALAGSVVVLTPDDSGKPIKSGSGTIITSQGHILTNFHVIGDKDSGNFTNKQGLVYIGINPPELNAKPTITYLAKVIKSDKSLDLALLRIVALRDGKPLPADLKLTPVPVGDSDKVQIGDEVSVIGFPGLGEGTVTFTKGSVSGFLDDAESVGTWFKTDAEINLGNSGGTAINQAGELVGIPTEVRVDTKVTGKIGKIRPVNFAKPFIQLAQQDAQSPVAFTFTPWGSSATVAPTAQAGAASFSQIVICDDHKDGKPVNPRTTFPAGTKQVVAYWTYKGMTQGQEWGRRWLLDGQVSVDKMSQQWNEEESGWTSLVLGDGIQVLDPGTYEIHLFIGKTEVQKATFAVQAGGAAPTVAPQTSPSFGKIIFAENVTSDGEIINPTNTFPAGTRNIYAYFTYSNMKNGDAWKRKWLRDGGVWLEKDEVWQWGGTGWHSNDIFMTDGSALASGNWEFVLYLGGKEVQRAAFTIGRAGAAPPPPAPTAPLNACPPNPHYVRLVNELNASVTINLSGPRTYRIVLPVGGTRDTCFVAGTYSSILSASGYKDTTETKTFATTTGNPGCWWFYPGAASATPCTAPTDLRLYSPPDTAGAMPSPDAINIFFTIQNGSPTGYVIDKQGARYTPPGYLTISGFHVNVGDRVVIQTDQPRFSMLFDCGTTPQIYNPCDFIAGVPSNLPAEIRKMARGTAFLNISRADNWAGTRPGFPSLRYPADPVLRIMLGD